MNTPGETVPASEEQAVRLAIERAAETLRECFAGITSQHRGFAIVSVASGRDGEIHLVGNGSKDELFSLLAYVLVETLKRQERAERHAPLAPPSVAAGGGMPPPQRDEMD